MSTENPPAVRHEIYHCPCCGELNSLSFERNDEYLDEELPEIDRQYQIVCDVHDGGCGMSSGFYHDPAKTVESWNRRTSLNIAFTKPIVALAARTEDRK